MTGSDQPENGYSFVAAAGGRFLTRGLNKARAEAALSVLAYNIIRAINLVGAATLRASLA